MRRQTLRAARGRVKPRDAQEMARFENVCHPERSAGGKAGAAKSRDQRSHRHRAATVCNDRRGPPRFRTACPKARRAKNTKTTSNGPQRSDHVQSFIEPPRSLGSVPSRLRRHGTPLRMTHGFEVKLSHCLASVQSAKSVVQKNIENCRRSRLPIDTTKCGVKSRASPTSNPRCIVPNAVALRIR